MSQLMIGLCALYAFAIDFFFVPDVRIEWDDSYVASNPEKKKQNAEPTDEHIREFRFLLFIYFRNVRNDIHSRLFLIMAMVVFTAKQIEPQSKGEWNLKIFWSQTRFITIIRSDSRSTAAMS